LSVATRTWGAVVVAAGRGTRFGRPKQLLPLDGLPLAGWSIRTFAGIADVADLVVVTETAWIEAMQGVIAQLVPHDAWQVVGGGETRQQSVYAGLRALPARCEAVLVHDGARPLVRAQDVRAGMREVRDGRGAVLAAPVVDTIKVVDPVSMIVRADAAVCDGGGPAARPRRGAQSRFRSYRRHRTTRAHRDRSRGGALFFGEF
jgi:2-C-methyl-D-erythritol 4-phosphate cytidylyltransferase